MVSLSIILQILKKSISQPNLLRDILEERSQIQNDEIHKLHTYSYDFSSIDDFFKAKFPNAEFSKYESELKQLEEYVTEFIKNLETKQFPSKEKPYPLDYSLNADSRKFLYFLCRILKPMNIVETGVAYGLSSYYILNALEKNECGKLYSIDSIFRPWQTQKMIGAIIPDVLKKRWKLFLGKSTEKLKTTLDEFNEIDIFIHDSLHTYENMMFEFNTAFKKINENGMIISDDVLDNDSFYDFNNQKNTINHLIRVNEGAGLGVISKN
jgi:predicted O-methyltransferase YrrM